MVIKEFIQMGDESLRRPSLAVPNGEIKSQKIKELVRDLTETIVESKLIGLAAPQAGNNVRIFVTKIRPSKWRPEIKEDIMRVLINPEITYRSENEVMFYEGCGSVANAELAAPVFRPEKVKVKYLDENGERVELDADGLLARVIQHEYDHLEGILFVDRVKDNREMISFSEYIKGVESGKIK